MAHQLLEKDRVEWTWKSNSNDSSQIEQWNLFSDIEIQIIEEAMQNKKSNISIDGYDIDLKNMLRISKQKNGEQNSIRRSIINIQQLAKNNEKKPIRLNRSALCDPLIPRVPFTEEKSEDDYLVVVNHHFNVQNVCYTDKNVLSKMIEKAASGIIDEGTLLGKQIEAQKMADELRTVINLSPSEIWKCCAHLYTKDTFLYRRINEIMRLVGDGDEEHKKTWENTIKTIGPYVWLLYWLGKKTDIPRGDNNITVYRGTTLSDELIEKFQQVQQNKEVYTFPAFSSVTRNREVAEMFAGNVIFIINIVEDDGNDLSVNSQFPDEEEILISSYFIFQIKSCEKIDEKWNINLVSLFSDNFSDSSDENSSDST